jgi:hypothetical protein
VGVDGEDDEDAGDEEDMMALLQPGIDTSPYGI